MPDPNLPLIDTSIVVPVYRSEKILPHLVAKVADAMAGTSHRFELILVNDASPDDSWKVIRQLAQEHAFVKGIRLAKNVGQHNATMAGLSQATGEVVVIMDDDLQHPPESILRLDDAIRSGFDVCYTRYENRQHAAWKRIGSWFNDRVAGILLKKPRGLYLSSFKALHGDIARQVVQYDGPFAYVDGLILDITHNVHVISIQHQERLEGKGNYNLRRSISLWLKMATSFSVFPLRLATALGMILTFLSLVAVALVVLNKLLHPELPAGWTSLIAVILLVGGLQTFCLGVVGEYLGRTYLKVNKKPQFVIREIT
ncbi:MAG: glycosyltransferase family 2 protein [Rudaea sp.]|uniref:glycosyltransferase family 2 protein n=1 Tax=unclassified Rudaea TaxID=2627037 RepID=UPI0010F6B120|nr:MULTISPECIES: glycosyltransferase family 2 protein [unclassified Rudaea]MBN8887162.1 glycosyltransferase family 2 protein [Rudaea sp.]